MLNNMEILATIPVKDLAKARKFYEGMLGLEPLAFEGNEVVTYRAGSSRLLVYHSQYAGSNKATTATWFLGDDLDNVVRSLKNKGVAFEHYQFPEAKLEGDVHVMGKTRNAWFKDPDGNILSLVNGQPAESRVGAR